MKRRRQKQQARRRAFFSLPVSDVNTKLTRLQDSRGIDPAKVVKALTDQEDLRPDEALDKSLELVNAHHDAIERLTEHTPSFTTGEIVAGIRLAAEQYAEPEEVRELVESMLTLDSTYRAGQVSTLTKTEKAWDELAVVKSMGAAAWTPSRSPKTSSKNSPGSSPTNWRVRLRRRSLHSEAQSFRMRAVV